MSPKGLALTTDADVGLATTGGVPALTEGYLQCAANNTVFFTRLADKSTGAHLLKDHRQFHNSSNKLSN